MAYLDDLPVELIQRIASFASARIVLQLIRVNRKFRSACDDGLVFKAVIENGNDYAEYCGLPVWNVNNLQCQDTDAWKRLAVADSLAQQLMAEVDPVIKSYMEDWTPFLIAYRRTLRLLFV